MPSDRGYYEDKAGGYGDSYEYGTYAGAEGFGETGALNSERSRRSFVPCTRQHFDLGTSFTPQYGVAAALTHSSTMGRNGFGRNSNGATLPPNSFVLKNTPS